MRHSYRTKLWRELVISTRYAVHSLDTTDAAHANLFTYVNLHFLWSCDGNFLSKEYTYSNHTNVSAQYVTLCLLEHILLYLYAAILTMIPSTTPEEVFLLPQRKYENLQRATGNWLICGSCTSCWDEYNAQCGSHESTSQNGPQSTNFLFPILSQYIVSTVHTVHAGSGIPVEYKHTQSGSWNTFSQSEKTRTGPLTVNYHYVYKTNCNDGDTPRSCTKPNRWLGDGNCQGSEGRSLTWGKLDGT